MDQAAHEPTTIRASEDGRYFVRPDGEPFFWLGDTQWELFRLFPLEQVERILANRRRLGFTCVQIMLVGVDPLANVAGDSPWQGGDPARPDERYFAHVDRAMDQCAACGEMVFVVGVQHTVRMKGAVHAGNAREWAQWVARRYRDVPNLVWSMYPRAVAEDVPICREIAAGLVAGDGGGHPITVHPDPSPTSSGPLLHAEPWLAFDSIQVFSRLDLIDPMVSADRARRPAKPVVMAEGAYEAGEGYGFEVTPLWIRRQAWYSYLAGGHHSYGHDAAWRLPPDWADALDAPGAAQMGVLRKILTGLNEWWRLVPDPALLPAAEPRDPRVRPFAARHDEGRWALIYTPEPGSIEVNLDPLGSPGDLNGRWIDPRTGDDTDPAPVRNSRATFSTPAGWEDGALVVEP